PLSRLAASPGFFWVSAAAMTSGITNSATKTKMFFMWDLMRNLRIRFKKLFRHRPVGGDKSLVAADQRIDLSIPHPLRRVRGQRGTISASAIHDDFCLGVRNRLLQVAFEHALAEVNRLLGVSSVPFMVLAYVYQNGLRVTGQPFARLIHRRLFHARPGFVDQPEESRCVLHE